MSTEGNAGKVAIITGGSSGIGRASAIALARQGLKVALVDIKEEKALEVKQEIEHLGGSALVLDTDVSDEQRMKASYQAVIDHWGRLDVVYANAGINGKVEPIEDLSANDWDSTLATNLRSTFLATKYAIPHMKKEGGSIIITSSINGTRKYRGFGMSAYSASKAGQVAFGKMAALELARYKIRVNIVCPGAIKTNIGENTFKEEDELEKIRIPIEYPEGSQPLEHKPGSPEQVADLVYFLASGQSNHITGSVIHIDGAESLL
ncbi:SDR family oxidoreductase [Halalkalibacter hemicellulosilyticus]|uniref:3-oxoacyl-[acyl-carrier protein] reductase n=1 Tax=Halalkalibacter hemicellulosilyticusJCM 9152 TaxID=1236971 RepID=W4QGI6_9BACI|nr:SDR family NAD(P)-dependent oxidoreductase [Halalkalibacter hemicellulosilyticus]GAE31027.1 3-oxoacyl-[acyl-carrier protein] reductase [Halalkalibacter hemicellulosilyticusJCM 9152]